MTRSSGERPTIQGVRLEAARKYPRLGSQYGELLLREGFLPQTETGEFVLYSAAAYPGTPYERQIAEVFDQSLSTGVLGKIKRRLTDKNKPKIIAEIDPSGDSVSEGTVKPFKNVDFERVSGTCSNELTGRVDIILDYFQGKLWHAQAVRYNEKNTDASSVVAILNRYREMLKPGGVLLVDAFNIYGFRYGGRKSTLGLLTGTYQGSARTGIYDYIVDLQDLGWKMEGYVSGNKSETELAVLRPISEK